MQGRDWAHPSQCPPFQDTPVLEAHFDPHKMGAFFKFRPTKQAQGYHPPSGDF